MNGRAWSNDEIFIMIYNGRHIDGMNKKARITLLDCIIAVIIILGIVWLLYRIRHGLQYHWNWQAMPQFLFRYDDDLSKWVPNVLIKGFFATIRLGIWSGLLAVMIGTTMALCRTSKSLFRRMVGRAYVELVRNTPPLVLIFIVYFFISTQVFELVNIDEFVRGIPPGFIELFFVPYEQFAVFLSGIITLALYEGAYIAEIIRAGILSIDKGQWEASSALGLSWLQQMLYIIFPQATPRILPPLAGQFISTIKDSAIVSVISIQELTFQGMELMASTYMTFEVWITITCLYFILTFICSLAVRRIEIVMSSSFSA